MMIYIKGSESLTQLKEVVVVNKNISIGHHFVFIATVVFFWFSIYIYIPVFSVYLEKIGFSYFLIGIILGSYGITQILLRFPLGLLSDNNFKLRKSLLLQGFIIAFISSLILIFYSSFILILIARLFAGITASMWVMATILYSYYFGINQSTKSMAILQFVTVIIQFISMGISGYLAEFFGYKSLFWISAIVSLIGLFFAYKIKMVQTQQNVITHQMLMKDRVKEVFKITGLKSITALSLLAHAILFITIFGFSPMLAIELKIEEKSMIWLVSSFFIPHAIASFILAICKIDLKYSKIIIAISFGFTALLLFIVPLGKSFLLLCILHCGIGLGLGIIFPILLSEVTRISKNEIKTSAMGFFQSFYALGIFLGPLIAGIIANNYGLDWVFVFTGGLSIIGLIIAIIKYPKSAVY